MAKAHAIQRGIQRYVNEEFLGGMSGWQQFAAATALGAAFLAGLYTGFWKSREELSSLCEKADLFTPSMQEDVRTKNLEGWQKAVRAAIFLSDLET
jgi:glycerol kinase